MRLALSLAIVALALAACGPAPGPPAAKPTPAATDAPLFESDAEALAAAEKVYREYSATADRVAADGGGAPERLEEFLTSDWYATQLATYDLVRESGRRASGPKPIVEIRLQQWDSFELLAYVCHDYSGFGLLDREGHPIPSEKNSFATFVVSFLLVEGAFRVNETQLWDSGDSCSF